MIPLEELIRKLDTDIDRVCNLFYLSKIYLEKNYLMHLKGLNQAQIYEFLQRDGPNILTPQPKTPKFISFLENLFGGFGILLLTGAGLCFIAYGIHYYNNNDHFKESLWLGIALIFVDLFSGSFSFYQVYKI